MSLSKYAKELAAVLKCAESSEEQIKQAIAAYYTAINQTEHKAAVGQSMKWLSEVFSLENLENGSIASLVCGSLIEHGIPAQFITDDFINFFKKGINETVPFLELCEQDLQQQTEEEDENDELDWIETKKEEFKNQCSSAIQALEGLDSYYQCGISIFSSSRAELEKGKKALSFVSKYTHYNSAFYWFAKLFDVLYDEPIIVIDLKTQKGIKGKMSGVVDNFQLQMLLMGLAELNEPVTLQEKYWNIASGVGPQHLDEVIEGKWNMYNWEYLKHEMPEKSTIHSNSKYWVWGEGTPTDISKWNGYRVVLLDDPSYSRNFPVQRTFQNLKAEIQVDDKLSKIQVEEFISKIKNK